MGTVTSRWVSPARQGKLRQGKRLHSHSAVGQGGATLASPSSIAHHNVFTPREGRRNVRAGRGAPLAKWGQRHGSPEHKGCGCWVQQNRRTRPTSPQTVPRLAAKTGTRPRLVCVYPSLSGVKSPTRSSVTASSNLRRARRTSTALSVACSSLRQKPGEQLLCCSHTLHS